MLGYLVEIDLYFIIIISTISHSLNIFSCYLSGHSKSIQASERFAFCLINLASKMHTRLFFLLQAIGIAAAAPPASTDLEEFLEHKSQLNNRDISSTDMVGGLVHGDSEFDKELKKLQAGEIDEIDWAHYESVNGTLVYSETPIDHKVGKRDDTQYGTVCLYKDATSCNRDSYYCWHTLKNGDCIAYWENGVNTGFISWWASFANVNFWTCNSDGPNSCAYSDQKWEPSQRNGCLYNYRYHRWSGLFMWHT